MLVKMKMTFIRYFSVSFYNEVINVMMLYFMDGLYLVLYKCNPALCTEAD